MSATESDNPQMAGPPGSNAEMDERTRQFSGFIQFVFEQSEPEDREQLLKWFAKPPPETPPEPEPGDNSTYAGVPDQLRRRNLLEKAKQYYLDKKSTRRLSTWLVFLFTCVFFVPASIILAFRGVRRALISLRRSPPTPITAVPAPDPEVAKESKPSPLDPPESLSNEPTDNPPSWISNVWAIARIGALYVVYIPITRYHGAGRMRGILLPSQSPKFLNDHAEALATGRKLEATAKEEHQRLKTLHKRVIIQRREALENMERIMSSGASSEEFEKALKDFESRQTAAVRLETAVKDAHRQWERVREIAHTETCAAATSYKGIADWASDAHGSYSNLMNAISGVCFVGAGLTYSSIFSATRGNLGLMAWAFSLFIIGLAIVITVQSLLMWCSRLENYPFSTPKLWEFFLGVGVYGACTAVIGAISILVVTVFDLKFNVTSDPYNNSNAANWDAHLIFDVNPRYAGIFAFSFIGAGVAVALLVFLLFSMANGIKLLLWRRSIERSKKPRDKLDDMV